MQESRCIGLSWAQTSWVHDKLHQKTTNLSALAFFFTAKAQRITAKFAKNFQFSTNYVSLHSKMKFKEFKNLKFITMKKVVLTLVTVCSLFVLNAQTYEEALSRINGGLSNEDFFEQSELVFEGNFMKIVATYNPEGGRKFDDNYAISAYKVHRIYKGDQSLTGEVIYLVSKGVLLGDENIDREGEDYDIGYFLPLVFGENGITCAVHMYSPSIFFFSVSDLPDHGSPAEYPSNKKYKFLLNRGSRLFICENYIAGLNNLIFNSREDFYDYMRQFEGYTVPTPASTGSAADTILNTPVIDNSINQHVRHTITQDELPDCAKAFSDLFQNEK